MLFFSSLSKFGFTNGTTGFWPKGLLAWLWNTVDDGWFPKRLFFGIGTCGATDDEVLFEDPKNDGNWDWFWEIFCGESVKLF